MNNRFRYVCLVLLLAVATIATSQQAAMVKRNTNLRPDPSSNNTPVKHLHAQDQLQLIDANANNGYYHIQTAGNDQGWVWGKNIEIQNIGSGNSGTTPQPITSGIA